MAVWTDFLEPDDGVDRFLSWPKVRDIADISRSTAWRLQNAGEFPLPVVLSPGRVGWSEREVTAWKRSRSPRGNPETRSFPVSATASCGPLAKPQRRRADPVVMTPPQHATPPSPTPAAAVARDPPVKSSRRARPEANGQTAFEF